MWISTIIFWYSLTTALSQKENTGTTKNADMRQELISGIDSFTNKLIHTLNEQADQNTNVLFSPINIYNALSFLLLGSSGETYDELTAALGFPKTEDKFLLGYGSLGDLIKSFELTKYEEPSVCGELYGNHSRQNCTYEDVTFANALFVHKKLALKSAYIENLKSYSRGTAENVDFENDSAGATERINKWVAEKTRNLISKLYASPIESQVQIMLTSIVYFSASWPSGLFNAFRSPEENFFTENEVIKVEYMFNEREIKYYEEELSYQAIQLPYRDEDYETIFILPNANTSVVNFAKNFTVNYLKKIMKKFKPTDVSYQIPYLDIEWSSDLVEPLKTLGLNKIFSSVSLSNMITNNSTNLKVSKISHASRLKMDEQGTVASAATVVELDFRMAKNEPMIEFIANRPYLFYIYHRESSVIIFSALIRNPKVQQTQIAF